jgi:hypothetical protein
MANENNVLSTTILPALVGFVVFTGTIGVVVAACRLSGIHMEPVGLMFSVLLAALLGTGAATSSYSK